MRNPILSQNPCEPPDIAMTLHHNLATGGLSLELRFSEADSNISKIIEIDGRVGHRVDGTLGWGPRSRWLDQGTIKKERILSAFVEIERLRMRISGKWRVHREIGGPGSEEWDQLEDWEEELSEWKDIPPTAHHTQRHDHFEKQRTKECDHTVDQQKRSYGERRILSKRLNTIRIEESGWNWFVSETNW
jgi:hypothetical protein